jgi:hypothetical protein
MFTHMRTRAMRSDLNCSWDRQHESEAGVRHVGSSAQQVLLILPSMRAWPVKSGGQAALQMWQKPGKAPAFRTR